MDIALLWPFYWQPDKCITRSHRHPLLNNACWHTPTSLVLRRLICPTFAAAASYQPSLSPAPIWSKQLQLIVWQNTQKSQQVWGTQKSIPSSLSIEASDKMFHYSNMMNHTSPVSSIIIFDGGPTNVQDKESKKAWMVSE